MKKIYFLMEERSACVMMEIILPKILSTEKIDYKILSFGGKSDMRKRIGRKLQAWREPNSRFLIVVDQDLQECLTVKKNFRDAVCNDQRVIIRVACRELESFYLGDLAAVEKGLGMKGLIERQKQKAYRDPDAVKKPSDTLKKITRQKYYKIGGSRQIAPHLNLEGANQSRSFNALIEAIRRLASF